MNLIEQQQKARALPMQYLQTAANGQSVELAPWIATAELQRRTTADQHMQAAKGPQGPQPTVKDQVEQKAGLMATQAAQQAQAAQAQQSATPPGPVPGGIPQPEPQPQEPVMAARGGLMNAPVNFKFAHGGILGFAGTEPQGSQVRETFVDSLGIERDAKTGEPVKSTLERMGEWRDRQQAQAAVPRRQVANAADERMLRLEAPSAAADSAAAARADDRTRRPSLQGQGIKAALPQPAQRPPAPRPAPVAAPQMPPPPPPPQAGQGQAQPDAMGPAGKAAMEFATAPTKERTLDDIIAENRAIQKAAGTDQPMGVDQAAQQARQDEIQQRQQAQAQRLARAAGVAASVGVPGSESLAYNQTLANALGKESEYGQQKYKNLAELEAARRKAAETQQTALETPAAAGRLASAAAAKDKAYTAANIYGTQEQSKASKYSADKHAETALAVQKLQDRAAAARQDSSDQKQALAELTQLERSYDADIKSLESQMRPLVGLFTPEAKAQVKDLNTQLEIVRDLKRRVRGGPAAAAPAGTGAKITPAQAAALAKYGAK